METVKNLTELFPDEPIRDPFEEEIHFNNTVREYVLFGLLLLVLYVASHVVVVRYRRKENNDILLQHQDDDEATVDRIALWLCTFSLSVSLGAVLLLPISILSNEVLTLYRDSWYIKWLNLSLIQGLWNIIFLFSNVSLFVGLPFAYLFTESEGFPGSKKGLKARILETVVVLSLLVVLVFGVAFIISALLGYYEEEGIYQIIGADFHSCTTLPQFLLVLADVLIDTEVWGSFYLPFLYSLISCLGVLMLLLSTPVGFAHLFTAVGRLMVKPGFLRDLTEEYHAALMQEEALCRQLTQPQTPHARSIARTRSQTKKFQVVLLQYHNARGLREKLEQRKKASVFQRTLAYPLALLLLLVLTGTAVVIVGLNTLQLLVGIKALPLASAPAILGEAQQGKRIVLLSVLGPMGAMLEVILILYLIAASILGFYSLPLFSTIRPRQRDTPMVHVISNCVVVLVLSSALPLLSRTLGITNFDLLGDFGRISWLGNFWIVLGYNVLFATAAAWCLVKKFTATIRHEIYIRFKLLAMALIKRDSFKLPAQVMNGGMITGANIKEE
ncbi:LMBR1-like protein lilipod isoform X1 [Oratosquilla oratoria]|uniref:LMBR1-like protein lilipod isoform X1 n=1 Tax=Oratosquilla oratoria TaxID=337810 RepID=UPI003F76F647